MRYQPDDFPAAPRRTESDGPSLPSSAARRRFLCACGCGLAISASGAALLAASSRAEAAAGGKLLKVGHLPAGCVQHLLLAKALGLFEKARLNVELTQFNSPADSLQALVAGKLDAIHGPWTTTVAGKGRRHRFNRRCRSMPAALLPRCRHRAGSSTTSPR